MRTLTLLALSFALVGCTVGLNPQVRRGDDYRPARVVLLPATCSSVDGACADEYVEGATGIVESELSFQGVSTIDARKLVAEARSRDEAGGALSVFGVEVLEASGRAQSGSIFEDLSPAQRRALLQEARADAIVTTKIVIGQRDGLGPVRKNQVLVRLGAGEDDALVWVSRCEAKSGFNPPISQSVATATHCALSGVIDGKAQVREPAL